MNQTERDQLEEEGYYTGCLDLEEERGPDQVFKPGMACPVCHGPGYAKYSTGRDVGIVTFGI